MGMMTETKTSINLCMMFHDRGLITILPKKKREDKLVTSYGMVVGNMLSTLAVWRGSYRSMYMFPFTRTITTTHAVLDYTMYSTVVI
jgi:hypothetical protein